MTVRRKSAAIGAVDRAVVAREGHRHHRPGDERPVARDRPLLDRADGEDRRLRRVEDGDELLHAVHAEVGDRERAALEVGGLQLAVARAGDEVGAGGGDLRDRQRPRAPAMTGTSRPAVGGDGDADVRGRMQLDRVARERAR